MLKHTGDAMEALAKQYGELCEVLRGLSGLIEALAANPQSALLDDSITIIRKANDMIYLRNQITLQSVQPATWKQLLSRLERQAIKARLKSIKENHTLWCGVYPTIVTSGGVEREKLSMQLAQICWEIKKDFNSIAGMLRERGIEVEVVYKSVTNVVKQLPCKKRAA